MESNGVAHMHSHLEFKGKEILVSRDLDSKSRFLL